MRRFSTSKLISVFICGFWALVFGLAVLWPVTASSQSDSVTLDSLKNIVQAEEIAALIPADYAAIIIAVNEQYIPEIEGANSIIQASEITRLRSQQEQLSRLTSYVLDRNNVLERIQSVEVKWRNQLDEVSQLANDIEDRTKDVIELKKELSTERAEWSADRRKLAFGTHPEQIHQYIENSIDTIDHFLNASAEVIDTFTVMYTSVVDLLLKSRNMVDRLKSLRQNRVASLLTVRNENLFTVGIQWDTKATREHFDYLATVGISDMKYYAKERHRELLIMGMTFVLFVFMFFWTRSRSMGMDDDQEPELVRNVHVLEQPFTMAVFSTIIVASLVLSNTPPLISYMISGLILYCILRILTKMMQGQTRWLGYTLAGMFLILQFSEFLNGGEREARWLTFFMSCGLVVIMYWVIKNKAKLLDERQPGMWPRLFVRLSVPFGLLAVMAILGNIIGYSRAASLVNGAIVYTLIIGMLLLSTFKSLMSVVYHFFRTSVAEHSHIIKDDGNIIFLQMTRILRTLLALVYIYYCLTFFLLWEPFRDVMFYVWDIGYTFGTVRLTIGDLINVMLTIASFYIIASILREVLKKEVFHRVNMPRGVGNAVASVTHYSLVVVGVFLALASAGFDTKHLGVLAGALGVGIGFGLQNIVNNFLSGLILVFERPITVDDVIEVEGVLGVVTSIGIRSSKIRQYNGDEVIVPNADLISKRVTNRTLSDTKRRYTAIFETGREVDPNRVIEIATRAAQNTAGILDDPPAKGYFKGTGLQTIEFYVNYWGSGNFLDLMSNVEMSIYTALDEAGVKMPVPVQIEIQKDDD